MSCASEESFLEVRKCTFSWHWALVTVNGDVLPCGFGSKSVGNLNEKSFNEIWNGSIIQDIRSHILAGKVHPNCNCSGCPFQRESSTFPISKNTFYANEAFVSSFDEEWYLETHEDARRAVRENRFVSGLEHFLKEGLPRGKSHRKKAPPLWVSLLHDFGLKRLNSRRYSAMAVEKSSRVETNAISSLLEYGKNATAVKSQPVDMVLAVTDVCNLRCVMCPQGMGLVESPHHMPETIVESLTTQIGIAARIILSGIGEPTLSRSFWNVIERVKDRTDLFMRVNTKGYFITPANAESILNSGLSEISFSLDAATPETYLRIRGGDFSRAVAGIRALVEARRKRTECKLEIYGNITLMRENIEELEDFVILCKELGVDAVGVSQLFPFGDTPDWKVKRKDWTFTYSEQMIDDHSEVAAGCIRAAYERSKTLGIPMIFLSETDRFLKMTGSRLEEVRRY